MLRGMILLLGESSAMVPSRQRHRRLLPVTVTPGAARLASSAAITSERRSMIARGAEAVHPLSFRAEAPSSRSTRPSFMFQEAAGAVTTISPSRSFSVRVTPDATTRADIAA